MALGKPSSSSGISARTSETIRRLEGLRKDATRPLSFRLDPRDYEVLERYAADNGLKVAQLVKSWVIARMRDEGLKK